MYMHVKGIDFASFYNFDILFCNCSDSVAILVFLLDFGIVPTVWYYLFFVSFEQATTNCIACSGVIFIRVQYVFISGSIVDLHVYKQSHLY